ncbi:MAG: DUF1491 family protein [Sphingomonas sp.]|uniref:DUF1491 family protein n=1 Tax=Sphingomonas sp. TaxID=28214 RepID=UPI00180D0499|nr:DUF1491 family protein [Sphingomonas sp.]MBA3667353.1 DUF1491 family protein [Sphingomonas sp.]
MSDRLPAALEATALLRQVDAEGGFATVLKKGDADRGALLLLVSSRGAHAGCLERTLDASGSYHWQRVGPESGATQKMLSDWSSKRVKFDEDLWLIDLDVADPERFIAETTESG